MLRLKRICDSEEVYKTKEEELKGFLLRRGYKRGFVDKQIGRVNCLDRDVLLKGTEERNLDRSDRLVLTLDFHPALQAVHGILRELPILVNSVPALKKLLLVAPRLSFRRSRNLKDILVRAKMQPTEEGPKGMFCKKAGCKICKFVETGSIFMGNIEKRSFYINHSFDCDSQGMVYLMTCERCGKKYVESTTTPFRLRFNNHKSSLRR